MSTQSKWAVPEPNNTFGLYLIRENGVGEHIRIPVGEKTRKLGNAGVIVHNGVHFTFQKMSPSGPIFRETGIVQLSELVD